MRMQIIIDDSSLVNRTYTTMLDSWIQLLGVINPQVVPGLYQFVMEKIGEAGRFNIPKELFKGVENQASPMGGSSQFKEAQSQEGQMNPEQALLNPIPTNEQKTSDTTGLPPIV